MMKRKNVTFFLIIGCIISLLYPYISSALTAEEQYYKAEVFYRRFLKNPKKLKYRENWLEVIDKFKTAYKKNQTSSLAPASLYMTGKLFRDLYKRSYKESDKQQALNYFKKVIIRFPYSNYKPKAETAIKSFSRSGSSRKRVKQPPSQKPLKVKNIKRQEVVKRSKAKYKADIARAPRKKPSRSYTNPYSDPDIRITGMRVWSNPSYTRIVVDADGETSYNHRLLNEDPSINKPRRLYIDFRDSRLGKNIKQNIPINDNLLIDARAGQYKPDSVRVVVDIKSSKDYKIFSLRNPFRTIIDVWGRDAGNGFYAGKTRNVITGKNSEPEIAIRKMNIEIPEPDVKIPKKKKKNHKVSPNAIAKQFALGVKRIVIDPGHGGRDAGAVGYNKRVLEKDIVLGIAKRLAKKIRQKIGCEVILTRTNDRFIALEERTAIANTKNADLFISLHTNAHKDRRAYGIETYFLNIATDEDAILVAQRENAASRKNISDLQTILNDLMQNSKINESSRLAAIVQKNVCKHMKKKYSRVKNKGVKQAPFYVLLGADMPSVLIETSFISNKRECSRLTRADYQNDLSESIANGIRKYIIETNPTAFNEYRKKKAG
ncbi:MAG: AMIN domain-containing protein [Desulfobacteraceae bacterium]|nr:AMIN domain-containing protein [Desulfobacteraceae bacterium]